jgi:CoA:oxalate CoA-transferase
MSDEGHILGNIHVIDLSHVYNGPYATFLMAMAGAHVIKVEPHRGEHLRRRAELGGPALPFAMLNSNKQTVRLDLKSEDGKALLRKLVAKADVLVENFAPGVMERLGLGATALQTVNPRLIYACSSGYGLSGPYRDYPAMDVTVQAMSGIIGITGFPGGPPVKTGPAVCDFFAGVHLYGGIVTALYDRERTGRGRVVEVAMLEAVYASLASSLGMVHGNGGHQPQRTGNRHGGLAEAPYNVYPTRDGAVAIIGVGDEHFRTLLEIMDRPELKDDPRFGTLNARVRHMDEIDTLITAWTREREKQRIADTLLARRVPCAPVRDLPEVMNDAHMHARGALQVIDHPEYGRVVLQGSPIVYHGVERVPIAPSGPLGRDTHAVYCDWLGLTESEVEHLIETDVI